MTQAPRSPVSGSLLRAGERGRPARHRVVYVNVVQQADLERLQRRWALEEAHIRVTMADESTTTWHRAVWLCSVLLLVGVIAISLLVIVRS